MRIDRADGGRAAVERQDPRKRGPMLRASVLLLAVIAGGCNTVYSQNPVGAKPRDLTGEKEQWEGTWMHSEGSVEVIVTDPAKGKLKIGWTERKRDGLEQRALELELRWAGKWTLVSVKDPDKPESGRYAWARLERKDRRVHVWMPTLDKFKQLVAAKKLPGTVRESKAGARGSTEVVLGTLGTKELDLITSAGVSLFEVWEPVTLLKVSK
jgi:hypothetical protein